MGLRKSKSGRGNRLEGGKPKSIWREYGEALIIALLLALTIRAFLVQAFSIPSGSMQPSLLIGDYLLVNKFSYGIRSPFSNKVWIATGKPQRGDIAVFIFPQDPSKDYIKRVVGLPGDKVQVINKKVYINGRLLETPQAVYADPTIIPPPQSPIESPRDNFGPVVVPQDKYFFMGDNRDQSYDSRFWGFVSMDALKGKAMIIYFSWEGPQGVPLYLAFLGEVKNLLFYFSWDPQALRLRWDRIGKLIK
jgi:signal peptidase I